MNCRTAKKQIFSRLDAVPAGGEQAAFRQHLSACAPCALLAQESDLMFQWLQEAPDAEPSENFDWRLKLRMAQLDRSGQRLPLFDEEPARAPWTLRFAVSAAAAAVLVLSLGLMRFESDSTPSTASSTPETSWPRSVPRLVEPTADVPPRSLAPGTRSDLPQFGWPRPVPVSHGAPLGPAYSQMPAPSILGPTRVDADSMQPQPVHTNIERR